MNVLHEITSLHDKIEIILDRDFQLGNKAKQCGMGERTMKGFSLLSFKKKRDEANITSGNVCLSKVQIL